MSGPRSLTYHACAVKSAVVLLACLLALTACCARLGRRPEPAIYGGTLVETRRLDTSCLRGKRVVLDPGHGGSFTGAMGRGGLKESDVNLGVALYLWGLLREAGAEVLLTRSSDRDFLAGQNETLRDDLYRRTELAKSFNPDVFLSLHHNADISGARTKNQIETYFKLLDEGPSRDIAVLIQSRLAEGLQIPESHVLPGNYYVLRNAACPAVLGEPSYLTNPWVEKKLRLAEKQLLEAQAYFLALLDYFGRGVPHIASITPCDTLIQDDRPVFSAAVLSPEAGIDSNSATCRIDGNPTRARISPGGDSISARSPYSLSEGTHVVCFSCRNLNGNASAERCCTLRVALEPIQICLSAVPASLPHSGPVLMRGILTNGRGRVVGGERPVEFTASAGSLSDGSVTSSDGVSYSLFWPDTSQTHSAVRVRSGALADSLTLRRSNASTVPLRVASEDGALPRHVILHSDETSLEDGFAPGRIALPSDAASVLDVTPEGLTVLKLTPGREAFLTTPGFLPCALDLSPRSPARAGEPYATVRLRRPVSGVLAARRITIDAADSGTEASPSRLASVCLGRMVSGAGAHPTPLFTSSCGPVPDAERVRQSEVARCELYLRIELTRDASCTVSYAPGSTAGKRIGERLVRWWRRILHAEGRLRARGGLPAREPSLRESAHYVLLHTSCPALIIGLPAGDRSDNEALGPLAAYALYLAVAEEFGLNVEDLVELNVSVPRGTHETATLVLDELIFLPAENLLTLFCEAGEHVVRLEPSSVRETLGLEGPETAREYRIFRRLELQKGDRTTIELAY
ncbi:MAG: N-acetylmuramoyl-L-alanine amidase [Candidatus Eisenbacteria bacterium]